MHNIIDTWSSQPIETTSAIVIPDGCNDVILKIREGEVPEWVISPLQDASTEVAINAGSKLFGFRLATGTRIEADTLIRKLSASSANELDAASFIENYCSQHVHISEALQTLSSREMTVSTAAEQLCKNQRGLQRLVKQETGKSPLFWIRLAKVRRAARDIFSGMPLSDCALENGYSDQAHLSREIKQWLGTTPSKLPEQHSVRQQLAAPAYN